MEILNEVFPVLGGILAGLIAVTVQSLRWRAAIVAGLGVAFGAAATWISGEWREGWEYLLFDISLVAGIAAAVIVLHGVRRRVLRRG